MTWILNVAGYGGVHVDHGARNKRVAPEDWNATIRNFLTCFTLNKSQVRLLSVIDSESADGLISSLVLFR